MDATLMRAPLLSLLAVLACAAQAQDLRDPTRPPATLTAMTSAPAAPGAGPQLQTILIGRAAGGRHLAVIDGETVQIGDSFHGARVARIGDNEVELVRGRERQVLRLYAPDAGGIMPADGAAHSAAGTAPARPTNNKTMTTAR